jgi:hypothetical protein
MIRFQESRIGSKNASLWYRAASKAGFVERRLVTVVKGEMLQSHVFGIDAVDHRRPRNRVDVGADCTVKMKWHLYRRIVQPKQKRLITLG